MRTFLTVTLRRLSRAGRHVAGAALLALAQLAAPAQAQLLWNRTGLPAVFPLQVESDPGLDWVVLLRDAATGDEALAAHFEGGAFFRVLVPPGTYLLTFTAGPHWSEEDGFGPDGPSRRLEHDKPLTFEVKGLDRKAGHIVDIRGGAVQARLLKPQEVCQDVVRRARDEDRDPADLWKGRKLYEPLRHDDVLDRDVPNLGRDLPDFVLRERYC